MENELQVREQQKLTAAEFNREQIDLIKQTVAKGTTDDELRLFLYTAKRSGLDPLLKQIHAIKRWSAQEQREVMNIQTGIDGYRLIAERTGRYAPGREPVVKEEGGKVISATAFVKKFVGQEWHEVGATAYFAEYVQKKKDGTPTSMWNKMPRLMTSKCAEALALRRAFPAEMSGLYTFEEMGHPEDSHEPAPVAAPSVAPSAAAPPPAPGTLIAWGERQELFRLVKQCGVGAEAFKKYLDATYGIQKTEDIRSQDYPAVVEWIKANAAKIGQVEQQEIIRLLKHHQADAEAFRKFLADTHGISNTGDIRAQDYPKVVEWIIRNGKEAK